MIGSEALLEKGFFLNPFSLTTRCDTPEIVPLGYVQISLIMPFPHLCLIFLSMHLSSISLFKLPSLKIVFIIQTFPYIRGIDLMASSAGPGYKLDVFNWRLSDTRYQAKILEEILLPVRNSIASLRT
ncbi:hypothetical protein EYC80_006104 [Monilinia laxa]|uniref:Uncharacterized protein n=1 Tax=Monilinia laxa TaxID=61186 RepID=A0A5N6KG48_MONLA|nr:hypothetical protein EYC80_006104 [Monilinia laxa]